MRQCDVEGCDKAHLAKGMCRMHYNREQPNRHAKVTMNCSMCGAEMQKEPSNRLTNRFCDRTCMCLWRLGQPDDDRLARGRKASSASAHARATPKPIKYPSSRVYLSDCALCGTPMASPSGTAKYCSKACANKVRKARKGKRNKIRRLEVFTRDGYTCWICDKQCDPLLRVPDPMAATVDHLIPSHFGGTDDHENLATAHLSCNSRRGASWGWPAA